MSFSLPNRPRVYLAGPDVFHPDAILRLAHLADMCNLQGLHGLVPMDEALGPSLANSNIAHALCASNTALLKTAQGLIANLAPFRGSEPDSGTVFEVGMAVALGLPVVAYGADGTYLERVRTLQPVDRVDGVPRDAQGFAVEDCDLPLNLMLSCSIQFANSADQAIQDMALRLRNKKIFDLLA